MRDFFFSSCRTHLKNPTDHAVFRAFPSDHVGPGGTMPSASGQESKQTNLREHKSSLSFPASSFSLTWKVVFLRREWEKCYPLSISQAARGGGKVYKQFFVFGRRRLHASFVFSISGLRFRLLRAASPSKRESVSLEAAAVTDTGCYDMGCVWTTQSDVAKS